MDSCPTGGRGATAAQVVGRVHVHLIAKPARGGVITGLSRYASDLHASLTAAGLHVTDSRPRVPLPWSVQRLGQLLTVDSNAFFTTYPVQAAIDETADVCHITDQGLALLLRLRRFPMPTVVTVHDILPYLLRNDPALNPTTQGWRFQVEVRLFAQMLAALPRAAACIASSEYTRQTLLQTTRLRPEQTYVVYLPLNHQQFAPQPVPAAFYARYGLHPGVPYVLYVGSEVPRKNVPGLLAAFAQVAQQVPDAVLLKVGASHDAAQHAALQQQIARAGLGGRVRFFRDVPDADLPAFYNAATVLVLPSYYEGFGYSVLEAMGCGCPVVCANRSSLPEVVGDAAVLVDPDDHTALARAIVGVVTDTARQQQLRAAGLARAATFTRERVAHDVQAVYRVAMQQERAL